MILVTIVTMGLLPDVQNSGLQMRRECRERFSPPQRVSDPDMHHGTCVMHVPWCMPETLTCGFLWSRWRGKRFRHSRCVRNPQPVKGKALVTICFPLFDKFILAHTPAWLLVYLISARKDCVGLPNLIPLSLILRCSVSTTKASFRANVSVDWSDVG